MPNNIEQVQSSEEDQESEITFIHTLPSEVLEKLRRRQQDAKDI